MSETHLIGDILNDNIMRGNNKNNHHQYNESTSTIQQQQQENNSSGKTPIKKFTTKLLLENKATQLEQLGMFRSSSAPPMEGLLDEPSTPTTPSQMNPVEASYRSNPQYYDYYYSHKNLNPRLPPPIIPVNNNLNHNHTTINKKLNNTMMDQYDDNAPNSPGAVGEEMKMLNINKSSSSSVRNSVLDLIQQDFPRTPSPVYNREQLSKLSAFFQQSNEGNANTNYMKGMQQQDENDESGVEQAMNQLSIHQQQQGWDEFITPTNTNANNYNVHYPPHHHHPQHHPGNYHPPHPQHHHYMGPPTQQHHGVVPPTYQQQQHSGNNSPNLGYYPNTNGAGLNGGVNYPPHAHPHYGHPQAGFYAPPFDQHHVMNATGGGHYGNVPPFMPPNVNGMNTTSVNNQQQNNAGNMSPGQRNNGYHHPNVVPPHHHHYNNTVAPNNRVNNTVNSGGRGQGMLAPVNVVHNNTIPQNNNMMAPTHISTTSPSTNNTSNLGQKIPLGNNNFNNNNNRKQQVMTHKQQQQNSIDDIPKSALMEEYKSGRTGRKFELSDIQGHVVEFSKDQHGSRFIQKQLERATNSDKEMVFKEVQPYALSLMTDKFGNYVIQKFFEYGTHTQKKKLAKELKGNVLSLTLQTYGCRVIQKALEVIDNEDKEVLVSELKGHVMRCVQDQNGNHVIQKCIEKVPSTTIQFIVDSFGGKVAEQAVHTYGCRVIQRILEYCEEKQTQPILDEILRDILKLVVDPYGNYVVQHVLSRGKLEHQSLIIIALRGNIQDLSTNKFASNVIEKCYQQASDEERIGMVSELVGTPEQDITDIPLYHMMKDQFANYVVQKIIELSDEDQRKPIIETVRPHVDKIRKLAYGKHILSTIEKYEKL